MSDAEANERWETSFSGLGERSEYKKVWDRQSRDFETAALAVAGYTDEATLDATARAAIETLRATVGLSPHDLILEIGCGIGRVGKPLSMECLHWFGADISGEMLKHAAQRLRERQNVTLIELSTVGLSEFPPDSLDLVYCTVVFMHLLEWDRFRYVQEAFRVLAPGGRCYFDNFPLDTEHGWNVFSEGARYPLNRRPAHLSMSSSREEFRIFLTKAGFEEILITDLPNGWIAATGVKPDRLSELESPAPSTESAQSAKP